MFSLATFLLLLVFGALPSVFDPARAYADEAPSDSARVIRVAYVQQEPMSPADESGAFVGYTYEYFERLAQYTGWSYEFVPVEGSVRLPIRPCETCWVRVMPMLPSA